MATGIRLIPSWPHGSLRRCLGVRMSECEHCRKFIATEHHEIVLDDDVFEFSLCIGCDRWYEDGLLYDWLRDEIKYAGMIPNF